MDNATALQQFEQYLRRRFPDRSTPVHYVSDMRQFQRLCSKAAGRQSYSQIRGPWFEGPGWGRRHEDE